MKKVMVIFCAAADRRRASLQDRTPLQVARSVEASRLATLGRGGILEVSCEPSAIRPEVLLARLLGLPAAEADRLALGPLEVRGAGLSTGGCSFVFLGNLVTIDGRILRDSLTRRLSLQETETLVDAIRPVWTRARFDLQPVGPGRLAVCCQRDTAGFGPGLHPALREGEIVDRLVPSGHGAAELEELLQETHRVLEQHPVNEVRVDLGENPANGLWLWGGGAPVRPLSPPDRRHCAALITNSPWVRGLGEVLGIPVHDQPLTWPGGESRAPGFRVRPVVESLRDGDLVAVVIEPPMDGRRYGPSPSDKVRALEWMDRFVLGPLCSVLEAYRPCRICLVTESCGLESQAEDRVNLPLVLSGDDIAPDDISHWDEISAEAGSLGHVAPEHVCELFDGNYKE